MTIYILGAFILSFLVTSIVGKFIIPWLVKQKAGQVIKENGPTWHMSKSGTPTMGGVMFIVGTAVSIVIFGLVAAKKGDFTHLFCFLFALVFGAIGFVDDYNKLKKKQNLGLTSGAKFALQLLVSVVFIFIMRRYGVITASVYIPFRQAVIPVPEVLFYIFAAFVIVGTVNAVNITDGVDGLVTGASIPVCIFFAALSFLWVSKLSLGIFASALAGGLAGFLIYNFHPAKVFMGDTGSLFLGGAIAALAFCYEMPVILLILGLLYVIETLSDIIQVSYYKLSHGKRVFKMAPFHHHLEMGGWTGKKWNEKELFLLYFIVSTVCAVISYLGVMNRFI